MKLKQKEKKKKNIQRVDDDGAKRDEIRAKKKDWTGAGVVRVRTGKDEEESKKIHS